MNEQGPRRLRRRDFLKAAASAAGVAVGSSRQAMAGGVAGGYWPAKAWGYHPAPGHRDGRVPPPAGQRAADQVDPAADCGPGLGPAVRRDPGCHLLARRDRGGPGDGGPGANEVARRPEFPPPMSASVPRTRTACPAFASSGSGARSPKSSWPWWSSGRRGGPARPRPTWHRPKLALGKCRVTGGNHNRTTKTAKTDEQFTARFHRR